MKMEHKQGLVIDMKWDLSFSTREIASLALLASPVGLEDSTHLALTTRNGW